MRQSSLNSPISANTSEAYALAEKMAKAPMLACTISCSPMMAERGPSCALTPIPETAASESGPNTRKRPNSQSQKLKKNQTPWLRQPPKPVLAAE